MTHNIPPLEYWRGGFKEQVGREPIPNKDFNPENVGDDYPFLTSTGPYAVKTVYIPSREQHEGIYGIAVRLGWGCPRCGKERGQIKRGRSYDGSLMLDADTWENPCSHVDKYTDCIIEAQNNGLNPSITRKE